MDILVLLVGEVDSASTCAVTLGHIQLERLCLDGLVGIGIDIIIGELHRRNGVFTLVARHGEEVVYHVSLHPIGRELGLVRYLRIIFVEVLGEVHHGLLDQFQVTHAAHNNTHGNGIIGFHLGLVQLGRDIELTHTAREVVRTLGQRIHMDLQARGLDAPLHLHIPAATIEEGLEGIDVAVLLDDRSVEGDARDLEIACHLRVHHILTPGDTAVVTTVHVLNVERLLLRHLHLLRVEAG